MALQQEVWEKDIKEVLFSNDNDFIRLSQNHDAYANMAVVHLPQAGAAPGVVKNRGTFPATISERTDTDKTYNLSSFTTNPVRIRKFDEIQKSYSKRSSLFKSHIDALNDEIALETMFSWATGETADGADKVIKTSGASQTTLLAPSATGSRNKITLADIRTAALRMDKDNVPSSDRYILLDSGLWYQLLEEDQTISRDYGMSGSLEKGVVGELYGFKIKKRSTTTIYDGSFDPKALGAAGAATDNLSGIVWQKNSVANALDAIYTYLDEGKADHFGDLFSAEVIHGATISRADKAGVFAISQTA